MRQLPEGLSKFPHAEIDQGYLALAPDGVQVRLRRAGSKLLLTFKRNQGAVREEREIELSPDQFDSLWPATANKRLTKTRYDVPYGSFKVEVDVYSGRHKGLIVAEVEFESESAARAFQPPGWLGEDVSGDPRYSNQLLAG